MEKLRSDFSQVQQSSAKFSKVQQSSAKFSKVQQGSPGREIEKMKRSRRSKRL
jgi:hypothetical protein